MKSVLGYIKGESFPLNVVKVDGFWMGAKTAINWIRMNEAAAKDGVMLGLNSAWRSMKKQQRLWQARQDPEVRKRKGGAARPGHSLHQSGDALDIKTGMGAGDPMKKPREQWTKTFRWLEENAPRFGFKRTVRREPWHWERVEEPSLPTVVKNAATGGAAAVILLVAVLWALVRSR